MLPRQYYLIGDEAFTNTPQFLTPYSGTCFKPCYFSQLFQSHLAILCVLELLGKERKGLKLQAFSLQSSYGVVEAPCHFFVIVFVIN
jgi:hypothetical protein